MCTGVRLRAKNGAVICGRTLEFGQDVASKILVMPRNFRRIGITPSQSAGLTWETKYAAVGANMLDETEFAEGVNEKGLAAGLFYFPNYAQYQEIAEHADKVIAPWQLVTWILTTCSSVQEVRKELPKIRVVSTMYEQWKMVPPIHVVVHDAFGKSLVIEYIQGSLVMHDNPLGVITNAPSFDWHITNLSNYINLTAWNIQNTLLGEVTVSSLGQGTGMLGLPGDFTPPSRFVRAVAMSQSVVGIDDEVAARKAIFHLLNLFDIPLGSVREKEDSAAYYEKTQWTSVSDLQNKIFYWRTYNNHQIFMVHLMSMDLSVKEPIVLSMDYEEEIKSL